MNHIKILRGSKANRLRRGCTFNGHYCRRVLDQYRLSVRTDPCWTLRPESADVVEPLFDHGSKSPRPRVVRRPYLISQPEIPEQRYRFRSFGGETSIRKPHKEIEHGRRCGQYL